MGQAEFISLSEVRARKQWDDLRQDLHLRFDQWLDDLEARLPDPAGTLPEVSDLVWQLRQDLTGGLTETLLNHAHAQEHNRKKAPCPECERRITARPTMTRQVQTMVGAMQFERPYFYCRRCQYCGHILGCLLINDAVIAKGFVLWTGFVQTLPIG